MSDITPDPAMLDDAANGDAPANLSATQADGLQAVVSATSASSTASVSGDDPAAAPAQASTTPTSDTPRAENSPAVSPTPETSTAAMFPPLTPQAPAAASDIDMVMDIPVQLSVELGRTRLTIKNILQLGQGSVVELDGMAGEPMDICVNGYLIAQGEVVVVDEKYGIRVTDIITPADRLHRLNQRR